MNAKALILYSIPSLMMLGGCQHPSPTHGYTTGAEPGARPIPTSQTAGPLDKRIPVPLLPPMAAHQRQNMRDHLAAMQEIIAAISTGDFASVERSAGRIGYSEQMGQMCAHMGAGAPGFTELALNFHRTADTIVAAAKAHDTAATLKAVSATLQTCVGCHGIYRQQIVDEAAWKMIMSRAAPSPIQP